MKRCPHETFDFGGFNRGDQRRFGNAPSARLSLMSNPMAAGPRQFLESRASINPSTPTNGLESRLASTTYLGRLVSQEAVRWMAVGKSSAKPGYICEHCQTEFDKEQEYLRLVTTTNKRLAKWIDRPKKLEDWHRIAQGLPTIDKEDEFRSTIDAVLREAYRKGEFYIDPEGIQIWKGSATQDGEAKTSSLLITHDEIVYGGLLRKRRWPTDAIVAVWADDSQIQIQFSGTKEAIGYEVSPIDLNAHLMSGEYEITLGPRDLAARLTFELGL